MKKKSNKKRISKKGLPPGSSVYIGKERSHETGIELISYDCESVHVDKQFDLNNLSTIDPTKNHWFNINAIHEVDVVDQICKYFGVHPLTIEDLLNTFQRPKSDEFDNYIFFTLKMLELKHDGVFLNVDDEQVSFILGKNFVLSFQEKPGDVFDLIRDRLEDKTKKVRQKGADYLTFALLDVIVDTYLELLESFNAKTEDTELKILETPRDEHLQIIQDIKYELINLRKHIYPTKEAVYKILRSDSGLINKDNFKYFNDLQDHIEQVIENVDIMRELNANQRDMYLSMISLKTNKVMEFLTIITSIFIPITFIVGVYGMNFEHMPELKYEYAYPITWGVMIVMVVSMVLWFKKRKWL
ncbi:MAG: magnesium/cobalt transporter CorA [Saprospiraceae bacterium]|nr:magnesium/cobalt transporter CorA [Saprospiraceae bacterium]